MSGERVDRLRLERVEYIPEDKENAMRLLKWAWSRVFPTPNRYTMVREDLEHLRAALS